MRVSKGDVVNRITNRIYKDNILIGYETFFLNKTTGNIAIAVISEDGILEIEDVLYNPQSTYGIGIESIL